MSAAKFQANLRMSRRGGNKPAKMENNNERNIKLSQSQSTAAKSNQPVLIWGCTHTLWQSQLQQNTQNPTVNKY